MGKFIDYIQALVANCSVALSDLEDFFSLKSLEKGEILLSMGSIVNIIILLIKIAKKNVYICKKNSIKIKK
ncbi:hypothetical protein [Bergeyella zoohelcum]|uniref:hypothetical protein n=1 Tax=Bergeyella zoohelcum TaxID=1015 RepID=UPI0003111ED5|nr:hypothetical protein [Bergeyella zoohelcum]